MARVTVEDCIDKVPNRFELVMLAVQRARDLSAGARLSVARDSDKNSVIALREIAESSVDRKQLWEDLQTLLRPPKPEQDDPLSEAEALFAPTEGGEDASAPEGADGDADENESKTWSEEEMLQALQEMEKSKQPAQPA